MKKEESLCFDMITNCWNLCLRKAPQLRQLENICKYVKEYTEKAATEPGISYARVIIESIFNLANKDSVLEDISVDSLVAETVSDFEDAVQRAQDLHRSCYTRTFCPVVYKKNVFAL